MYEPKILTCSPARESRSILEHGRMQTAYESQEIQKIGKDQLEAVAASTSAVVKSWQTKTIAAEATEYSKKSLETGSVFLEKLLGAKSFENAIKIQLEYAKVSYQGHVAYVTKIGELYSKLAKEAFAPVETAITKVQAFKE